ncbi:uncharacterized protein LOC119352938 [Triticum dicoccoides]|uniref:uncharacterized protein LOC119352938 n=1 Tax=Triticum dicoccoides TaxID=85692 RepID=UPI00188FCE8D|nr:uncharacterized protein LOC119352938 [Triticum dicoccoides]
MRFRHGWHEVHYEESDAGFVPRLEVGVVLRDGVGDARSMDDGTSGTAGVQDGVISSEPVRRDGYPLEDESAEQTEETFVTERNCSSYNGRGEGVGDSCELGAANFSGDTAA